MLSTCRCAGRPLSAHFPNLTTAQTEAEGRMAIGSLVIAAVKLAQDKITKQTRWREEERSWCLDYTGRTFAIFPDYQIAPTLLKGPDGANLTLTGSLDYLVVTSDTAG